jgi:hypothetical protein
MRPLVFASALLFLAGTASAQRMADLQAGPALSAANTLPPLAPPADTGATVKERVSKRSPVLAGALSYLVPGTGSFYAGNNQHGVIHLAVHVIAIGMVASGFNDCFMSSCDSTVLYQGLMLGTGNAIWSIVTGVLDAHERNKKADGR